MKNKQQLEAEARAKKDSAPTTTTAALTTPAPTPQATAPVAKPQPPSRQQLTLAKLEEAWKARGVDLSKMEKKEDGKFLFIMVGEGWPAIMLGATGGIDLPAIKSYPKAFEAAIIADQLFAKQREREAKKLAAAATPAPPAKKADAVETKKQEPTTTPSARKAEQHKAIESRLQA